MNQLTDLKRLLTPANLALGGALIVFVLACIHIYVGNENAFYWSDYNSYQFATTFGKNELLDTPLLYPLYLFVSASEVHNLLFTVPLTPIAIIFGNARTSYISNVALIYFIPYVLLLAAIASRILKADQRLVFWTSVGVAICIPVLWAPTLRGYPDNCAGIMVGLALLIYLGDQDLRSFRRAALIGLLLGLAPLLRRYFFFESFALGLAILFDQISYVCQAERKENIRQALLVKVLPRMATIAAAGALLLCTVGLLFVLNIVQHNYIRLYDSFKVPPLETLSYMSAAYGAIAWLLAAAGYMWGVRCGSNLRRPTVLVLVFATLSAVFWTFGPGQLGSHYTLYFNWLIFFGVVSFLFATNSLQVKAVRISLFSVFALWCVINCFIGFAPLSTLDKVALHPTVFGMLSKTRFKGDSLSRLFSANYSPRVRDDREQVFALVEYLRKLAPHKEMIYTNSFADALSMDVIKNAERTAHGMDHQILNLPDVCTTDSRDSYPLEEWMQAKVILIVTPMQGFIKDSEQKLLQVGIECFANNWAFAQDFVREPVLFKLDNGVAVAVYRRIRPTSVSTAIKTLAQIKSFMQVHPGSAPGWISSGKPAAIAYDAARDHYSFSCADGDGLQPETAFIFYANALPKQATVTGKARLKSGKSDDDGKEISEAFTPFGIECTPVSEDGTASGAVQKTEIKTENQPFSFTLNGEKAQSFVLALSLPADKAASAQRHLVELYDLKVSGN